VQPVNIISRRKDPHAQPFEQIHQNYNNSDEYVSPMTGRLDNTHGLDRGFEDDTAYHGGGGMPEQHRAPPTFSAIAGANPFADDAEAPPPPSGSHRYTDVSRQNPFSDRNEYRRTPPKPLSERAYTNIPPRHTPSPNTPSNPVREQAMPLVNEMDTENEAFSHTWAKASREHGFDGGHFSDDDDEDDDSEHGHIQIATTVTIAQGRTLDREAQSEALRQVDPSGWEAPHLRTVRSDISSLHHSPVHQQTRNITSAPGAMQYQRHNASNSSISSYRGTPTPAMQAAALSRPAHPLEQEQSLLDDQPTGWNRFDSEDSTYSPDPAFSRNSSSRSSLRPSPAAKSSLREKRVSFGLNNTTIGEALNGSDGWRGSGIDGQGSSPAWSGLGGGWLEGQSGMVMPAVAEVPTPDEGPHELPASGPSMTHRASTIKRRPVSGVPILNSPGQLQREFGSERVRKGAFGALQE
jgi:hypothetical protein